MRRRVCLYLAVASLLAPALHAATRPRYGGTLRIAVRESLISYEPISPDALDPAAGLRQQLALLIFDRLTRLDARGDPQPALATSWEHDPDFRRWSFHLRRGVVAHDGSPLTPGLVANSLIAADRDLRVRVLGNDIAIEHDAPLPDLPATLATTRYSIVMKAASGVLFGTGPFRVAEWQPGRAARLTAFADHWAGSPFVAAIALTMGRSLNDQALDRQLDRVDISQLSPGTRQSATSDRVVSATPLSLIAIFWNDSGNDRDRLHDAVSLAIDRRAIAASLLQGQAEPAGGLLPQSVSGYAFLFPTTAQLAKARDARGVGPVSAITLAYDASDSIARAIAERIAVNVRDTALTIQTVPDAGTHPAAEGRIVRLPLPSSHGEIALAELSRSLHQAVSAETTSSYDRESAMLNAHRITPLVFVPDLLSISHRVRQWSNAADGWRLADAWLEAEKP